MGRRTTGSMPALRWHKSSGKAVVTLSGQDFYCGTFGSKTALAEYDRQVAEWLARQRRPLQPASEPQSDTTIVELLAAYKRYAEGYYRKHDQPTNEIKTMLAAARVLQRLYGREPVSTFGPLKLQAVQQAMIRLGWSRMYINKQIGRLIRIFAWGVSQELVRSEIVQALREVDGLRKGRTEARETAPVLPVKDTIVQATLPHLAPIVADMVRLQRLTGCRPEEAVSLRPLDVDASGPVWAYRPKSHKTEHHERQRVIFLGPQAQQVLKPYLQRPATSYCFSQAEADRSRRAEMHVRRRTPPNQGNRPGTNRRRKPARSPGDQYTTASYRRAIQRACDLAFAMPPALRKPAKSETPEERKNRLVEAKHWRSEHTWSPNQLRHSAATEIRKQFGLEAAQVILGHAAANVTQVYAERDLQRAEQVMAIVG
jgi:integrase